MSLWYSSLGVCSECPPCGTNPVYACPASHCTSEGFDDHLLLSLHVGTGFLSAVKVFSLVWPLKRSTVILPRASSKYLRESLAAAQLKGNYNFPGGALFGKRSLIPCHHHKQSYPKSSWLPAPAQTPLHDTEHFQFSSPTLFAFYYPGMTYILADGCVHSVPGWAQPVL